MLMESTAEGNMCCIACLCPNTEWRYRLSKQAKEKTVGYPGHKNEYFALFDWIVIFSMCREKGIDSSGYRALNDQRTYLHTGLAAPL